MKQKKKWEKEITKFRNMTVMVTEDDNGHPVYYVKEHPSLTFTCVDEAEDYIEHLYRQSKDNQ